MLKKVIIVLMIIILFSSTITAINSDFPDSDNWQYWDGPDVPDEGCWNDSGEMWENPYVHNETPDIGELDVTIKSNGVETCVNITIGVGCVANITFQWLNYSLYYAKWLEWAYVQNWYDYDNVSWATEPNSTNNSFWFNYYNESEISHSQKICFNNSNVSCFTYNDWETWWFDWRVIANFTCAGSTYNTTCYFWFEATECPVSYIYPPSPNGTICPCCDSICVNVTNEYGHPMNLTFFANDTMNETFYIINKYINVSNGTYCFCTCGHVDDIFYPLKYNETYHWYVNITDTSTGVGNNSAIFQFSTVPFPTLCPCSYEDIKDLIEDTDKASDEAWLIGLIIVFFVFAIYMKRRKK